MAGIAHKGSKDAQNFIRTFTDEEKKEYKALSKGSGLNARKLEFREMISAQRLSGGKASQVNTSESKESDTMVGTYLNFWKIAEAEGGLMDREFGIH